MIDKVKGDCFAACLKSILEREDVPNCHTDRERHWLSKYNEFLRPLGYQISYFVVGHAPTPFGYFIISVKSYLFEGQYHSVVGYTNPYGESTIVHNPNSDDPRRLQIPVEDWRLIYLIAHRFD